MKRNWLQSLLMLLAVFVLTACGTTEEVKKTEETQVVEETNETIYPYTVIDATGEEVTIESEPKTVVSLMPSNTEILYELQVGERIIGVTENDTYPQEVQEVDKVGDFQIDVERVIALQPELVFAHAMSMDAVEQLKTANVPVIVVENAESFAQTYETIDFIANVMNQQEQGTKIIDAMKRKVQEIQDQVAQVEEPAIVFVEISPAPELYTAGKSTFMAELLTIAHAQNAFEGDGWALVDAESVIDWNPAVYLVQHTMETPEQIEKRPGFEQIQAIQEKRIYAIDPDLVSRPGPRLVEGLEQIAQAIYPEHFE